MPCLLTASTLPLTDCNFTVSDIHVLLKRAGTSPASCLTETRRVRTVAIANHKIRIAPHTSRITRRRMMIALPEVIQTPLAGAREGRKGDVLRRDVEAREPLRV